MFSQFEKVSGFALDGACEAKNGRKYKQGDQRVRQITKVVILKEKAYSLFVKHDFFCHIEII